MTSGQELVLDALKSADETLVVGVLAALEGAPAQDALRRDAEGRVTSTRPGERIVIPFNDKERITAVRETVAKKSAGWTWRGAVEDTVNPSC
jgi:hypothetical protein